MRPSPRHRPAAQPARLRPRSGSWGGPRPVTGIRLGQARIAAVLSLVHGNAGGLQHRADESICRGRGSYIRDLRSDGRRRTMSSPSTTHKKPQLLWATPADTPTAIPIAASTAIEAGARARTAAPAGRRRMERQPGPGVRAGCWEDLAGDPSAHPRSGRPGPARCGLRAPRASACPPGNSHSGRIGPHRGRHRKPSPQ